MIMQPPNTYADLETRSRFYESELLAEMPRLLSALDRCPLSEARGSFDREYWAWATKDFSNMDLQRGVRILAYLYSQDFPNNSYFQEPAILNWTWYAVNFWLDNQSADGSMDHLYVHEKSWMGAAFTLMDFVDAYRRIGPLAPGTLGERWLTGMNSAARCLVNRDELHGFISNHRAGAAAALMGMFHLTGEKIYSDRALHLMDQVYARQSPEGWFLEYEGADPGYQTLDTHYQGAFYQETGSEKVLSAVERSLEFLSYFMHPDGSVGGEYGSRSCPHFFPGGFEIFGERLPLAEALACRGVWSLASGNSAGLADADFRNRVPLATSYVLAHQAVRRRIETMQDAVSPPHAYDTRLPYEKVFEKWWPEAGLYVRSEPETYFIFGASKGGVIKYYSKKNGRLLHSSCGYVGRLSDGGHVTTHLYSLSPEMKVEGLCPNSETPLQKCRIVCAKVPFFGFSTNRVMSPLKFLLFRIFNLTMGRFRVLNDLVRKHYIIKHFLKRRIKAPLILEREVHFADGGQVTVHDRVSGQKVPKLAEMREYGFVSTVYMASAKYFRWQDLKHDWKGPDLSCDLSALGHATASRAIGWRDNGVTANPEEIRRCIDRSTG